MKKAFVNGYVIEGKADSAAQRADVLVEDGKIVFVGEVAGEQLDGFDTVDCTGKYIMPGLINMHAHLFGSGKPSKSLGGGNGQKRIIQFIQTGIGHKIADKLVASGVRAELDSGVTTIRGVGDFVGSDLRTRDRVKAGKLPGPRIYCSGTAITVPTGHGDGTFAEIAETTEDFCALVDAHYKAGVDLIKICVTGGVMDAKKKGNPGELKMNLEQTKAVCDRAHELGLRVASHTESPEGMVVAIEGGVDTIEHGAPFDEEHAGILKERNGGIIVTLSPALPLYKLPTELTKLPEMAVYNSGVVMNGMIKGAKEAKEAGIPVGLGTDASCPFATQHGMWREVWYYQKMTDVSAAEAISAATLVNAKILGIDDITGSVECGKYADLFIANGNPLEDLAVLREPFAVVKEGVMRQEKPKKDPAIEAELDKMMEDLQAELQMAE
ncbi:MAG: amidohydrolase family protein [Firmicutes bacterium]|nr:amidohydrolase family protein [Bacillota bacterium]MDY5857051.1 amidohydrolase family protein [Anaerovoracaceae bacterium]